MRSNFVATIDPVGRDRISLPRYSPGRKITSNGRESGLPHSPQNVTVLAHQRRRRPTPLLDARGYRGDLSVGVCAGIFRVRDQPIDRPPFDLVRRPRPLIFRAASRAGARAATEGKCWRFYPPAAPPRAALRLAPLIVPMIDFIQSARGSRRTLRLGGPRIEASTINRAAAGLHSTMPHRPGYMR